MPKKVFYERNKNEYKIRKKKYGGGENFINQNNFIKTKSNDGILKMS